MPATLSFVFSKFWSTCVGERDAQPDGQLELHAYGITGRIFISLSISMAFLLASFVAFGLLAANQAPRWLIAPFFLAFAWPMSFMSSIFPNAACPDGHEVCGYGGVAYLATAIFLPILYSSITFLVLTWRATRVSKKHPA